MKNIKLTSLLILLLFANCEKVVDINLPTIEPKLIVDAFFEINFNENPISANTTVKLRLSADYFEDEIPAATNAVVFLTNLSNNSIINFTDVNESGNYNPINTFIPEDDIEYELTIIYENETYKGNATKIKGTTINSINQGDDTLFSGDEIELEVSFTDNEIQENYYLFDFSENLFVSIEDRFFNGSEYNFSYYLDSEEVILPSTRIVTLSAISQEYFTYFRILQNQSGQNAGGPFETVPSSLLGNMINTTNEDNFPLGYFHISEIDKVTVDLVKKD